MYFLLIKSLFAQLCDDTVNAMSMAGCVQTKVKFTIDFLVILSA